MHPLQAPREIGGSIIPDNLALFLSLSFSLAISLSLAEDVVALSCIEKPTKGALRRKHN